MASSWYSGFSSIISSPQPLPTLDTVKIPEFSEFPLKEDLDILIYTQEGTKLHGYLKKWKDVFQGYDIIAIIEGDDEEINIRAKNEMVNNTRINSEFKITIYTRTDINEILKERSVCISKKDSASRCFGILMSKKKFIFTVDVTDCLIAKNPAGKDINPLIQHSSNLLSASTPNFFNPTYDPFKSGNDFCFGYPNCLRQGVPTAISHGLWLNIPHYDAALQLMKPGDRNEDYVCSVMTIPKGCLYPMCGMNLCFNRELIGPAMYFGLMGDDQPLSRYGDVWAGFCSKVICDHLGFGVKSGMPYVWHGRSDDAVNNYKKDVKWVEWQERVYLFFKTITFPVNCDSAEQCYRHLAKQVKQKLAGVDPYFGKLSDAMILWIEAWEAQKLAAGETEWSIKTVVI